MSDTRFLPITYNPANGNLAPVLTNNHVLNLPAGTTLAGSAIESAAALGANLIAIQGLTSAANKGIYFTGSGTAATFDLSTFARTFLDDADGNTVLTTLGGTAYTGSGGVVRKNDAQLYDGAVTPKLAADIGERYLYGTDGIVKILSWDEQDELALYDGNGVYSVYWSTRTLVDDANHAALRWTSDERSLLDGSVLVALDWKNRNLLASDGTSPVLDWSSSTVLTLGTNTAIAFLGTGAATTRKNLGADVNGLWNDSNFAALVKPAVAVVAASNLTLSGEQTIDGVTTSTSLVLATAQSTGSQNGPWISGSGAWTRPTWYTNGSTTQAPQFLTTFVRLGTAYQGSTWRMTTASVTIGTTSTTWVQTPISLASTNVTGTLPVASGGTGITSFGSGIATFLGTPSVANFKSALSDETTVVGNLLSLANPSAISFIKIAADNTVSTRTPAQVLSDIGAGTGDALVANPLSQFAATTSAQLRGVLSDENGTGAALFSGATSPVFVTPDLGTPSALVVTNASGTASININGTVGATTPAAGTFTTLTNTGAASNSKSGAASVSALALSGVPFAGTGTTSFPLVYINDANATASTTLATAGTSLGVNQHGTSDLINLMTDGASKFKVGPTGNVTAGAAITASGGGWIDAGSTGWYQASSSSGRIFLELINGCTLKSAGGSATWNDFSTANSGTVANRYIFGIAAPTFTSTGTSVTDTVASTVYIGGAPTASTNTTIGTAYALNVASGDTLLGGNLTINGTTSLLLGTAGSAVGNIGFRNATSGTATLSPPPGALGTYTVTLPNAASTIPIASQQITWSGPTAARTYTLPDAAATLARTDAAQTFTGTQTFGTIKASTIVAPSDSTTAVQITKADGTTGVGVWDTTNGYLTVNSTGNAGVLTLNRSSGSNNLSLLFQDAGTTKGFFGIAGGTNGIITGSATNDVCFRGITQNILLSADNGTTAGIKLSTANVVTIPGTLAVTGASTLTGGVVGTTAAGNATAGNVGEYVESLVAIGSPVSLTTATAANITTISLTAGDWDVVGLTSFTETTATVSARTASIGTTSATLNTDGSEGYCGVQSTLTSEVNSISISRQRINVSSTTTVYLVGKATFSAGTCGGFGKISARRVR